MKPEELEDMTTLTIKTNALDNNIRIIKRLANGAKVIAVLKGNAYGLGLTKFASFLQSKGIDNYGVTELSDAVTLRRNGITGNILLMTPLYNSEDITTAIDHDITLSITSTDCAHVIDETAAYMNHPTVHAHLCIDTGFGRYGFLCSDEKQIANTIQSLRHIKITGIFSHFHAAACRNEYYVKKQFQDFTHLCDALRKDGIPVGIRHISSSTSMIKYPSMNLDAIRIGSAFLGRLAVPNDYGFVRSVICPPMWTISMNCRPVTTLAMVTALNCHTMQRQPLSPPDIIMGLEWNATPIPEQISSLRSVFIIN